MSGGGQRVREMARKRVRLKRPIEEILDSARKRLELLDSLPAADAAELTRSIDGLVALSRDLRELSLYHSQKLLPSDSASERILEYLRMHVGQLVEGEALDLVSAITENKRRVREWRVEFGLPIEKRGSGYVLTALEPDAARAERWATMNAIRRGPGGDKKKALALFQAYPEQILTTAQLKYVMKSGEMRRVRDLRLEDGWRVFTKNTGRPDLKQTQYILVDPDPIPEHDRQITDAIYSKVLKRDGHRCQKADCGWTPTERVPGDKKQYIELHHVTWHSQKGENNLSNLIALCNVHHRDLHREKIGPDQFEAWLTTS